VTARVAVVGLGTVGSWLLRELESGAAGDVEVVLRTSGRDGREGELRELDYDVLAQCVNSPEHGEPGIGFMRDAIARERHVVTSDKWPVALHGAELASTAHERGVAFRAESTVMSGTPLLAPLTGALGGRRPTTLRGVVNATVNQMLTRMAAGESYEQALAGAQADGLAEPDPSADVDGRDEEAKTMILSALVFGHGLARGDVRVRGISRMEPGAVGEAAEEGLVLRSVTTIAPGTDGRLQASVKPAPLPADDPLATVSGVENAVIVHAEGVGELRFQGPGAGPQIAGKGVLDDLRALVDPRAG
jgi:homoserine dehydrogenase